MYHYDMYNDEDYWGEIDELEAEMDALRVEPPKFDGYRFYTNLSAVESSNRSDPDTVLLTTAQHLADIFKRWGAENVMVLSKAQNAFGNDLSVSHIAVYLKVGA